MISDINDTGNNNVASIVETLTVGSTASAVAEQEAPLSPPVAVAGPSRPTDQDNLDLAREYFLRKYIKNGQVQNLVKGHFSLEEQSKDLELKHHWQSVLTAKKGNVSKAID